MSGLTPRAAILAITAGVLTGLLVAVMAAFPIAALRAPRLETRVLYTADVLDTGTQCVYVWADQVYLWSRQGAQVTQDQRCPSSDVAYQAWSAAQRAPVPK